MSVLADRANNNDAFFAKLNLARLIGPTTNGTVRLQLPKQFDEFLSSLIVLSGGMRAGEYPESASGFHRAQQTRKRD